MWRVTDGMFCVDISSLRYCARSKQIDTSKSIYLKKRKKDLTIQLNITVVFKIAEL